MIPNKIQKEWDDENDNYFENKENEIQDDYEPTEEEIDKFYEDQAENNWRDKW